MTGVGLQNILGTHWLTLLLESTACANLLKSFLYTGGRFNGSTSSLFRDLAIVLIESIAVVMNRFSGCTDYCLQQFAEPLFKFCEHNNKCILKSLIWEPDLIYGNHRWFSFPWISDPSEQSNGSFVIKKTWTRHVLQAVVDCEYWYNLKLCSIILT